MDTGDNEDPNIVTVGSQSVKFTEMDDKPKPGKEAPTMLQLLTAETIMQLECTSDTFNIEDRFWKAWLISQWTSATHTPETFTLNIDMAANIDRVAQNETRQWLKQQEREVNLESIPYETYDEDEAEKFERSTLRFNNTKFQRENVEESCRRLGIPWKGSATIMRPPGMAISLTHKFWQPPAVAVMMDCYRNPNLRRIILGDATGSLENRYLPDKPPRNHQTDKSQAPHRVRIREELGLGSNMR